MSRPITEKEKMELLNGAVAATATSHFNDYRKQLAEVSQILDIARCTIFNIIDVITYKGALNKDTHNLEVLTHTANGILSELTKVVNSVNIKLGEKKDGKSDKK